MGIAMRDQHAAQRGRRMFTTSTKTNHAKNPLANQRNSRKEGLSTMTTKSSAAPDVEVTQQNPLYITDDNRNFNTVTVLPGGQIWVKTIANITIQTLTKKTS